MKYSDTINLSGIIQLYEKLTDVGYAYISGDTERLKEATALANNKSSLIWHTIHNITGNWKYDDSNYDDLPFATTDLVLGQRRYALPSDALTVQRVEIKDESDDWYQLRPITKEQIKGEGIDDFLDDNGRPMYYSLVNGIIELYAPTDYDQDDSLKVYYDRGSVEFETSDTTATPGFASPYHEILPIMMAIDWYNVKQPTSPTLPRLEQQYLILERNIKEFYGKRFKDYKPKIGRARVSYR